MPALPMGPWPCLWRLPPENLAWFVIEAVEVMGLSAFHLKYRSNGNAAWHPNMMLGLLLNAYRQGVLSIMQVGGLCEKNVPFTVSWWSRECSCNSLYGTNMVPGTRFVRRPNE